MELIKILSIGFFRVTRNSRSSVDVGKDPRVLPNVSTISFREVEKHITSGMQRTLDLNGGGATPIFLK